jgi:hypothetical protein
MKKAISLILTICTCLCLFTACGGGHEHTFEEIWSKDANGHWRACTGCSARTEEGAHAWDGGVITIPATPEADGIRTYSCIYCGETATGTVKYRPKHTVTEAEWQEALQKDLFYNVSVNYASCRYDEGSGKTDESTTLFKYDGEKMSGNGKVRENVAKTDMSTDEVVNILSYGKDGFAESEFDAENGQYFVMAYNGYYEMRVGLIYRFTDGKLVHFEFHFLEDGTKDGMYRSNWLVFDFYDYGVTQID